MMGSAGMGSFGIGVFWDRGERGKEECVCFHSNTANYIGSLRSYYCRCAGFATLLTQRGAFPYIIQHGPTHTAFMLARDAKLLIDDRGFEGLPVSKIFHGCTNGREAVQHSRFNHFKRYDGEDALDDGAKVACHGRREDHGVSGLRPFAQETCDG